MSKEKDKGIWVSQSLAVETGLSGNELFVYACIYNFSQDDKSKYYGGLNFICKCLNITKKTALNTLDRLIEKKLIYKYNTGYNDVCYATYDETSNGEDFSQNGEDFANNDDGVKSTPYGEDFSQNGEDSSTPSKINKQIKKTNTSLVVSPQREEIVSYCQTKNIPTEIIDSFLFYYSERDWCRYDKNLKKNIPLKDWKLALQNWARNEKRFAEEKKYKEMKYQAQKQFIQNSRPASEVINQSFEDYKKKIKEMRGEINDNNSG